MEKKHSNRDRSMTSELTFRANVHTDARRKRRMRFRVGRVLVLSKPPARESVRRWR